MFMFRSRDSVLHRVSYGRIGDHQVFLAGDASGIRALMH